MKDNLKDNLKIYSIKYLDDGRTLINNSIKVHILNGELKAEYDNKNISKDTAIRLIKLYLGKVFDEDYAP